MVKYLSYRKFNHIDLFGSSFGAIKLFEGYWMLFILILGATLIVSGVCEGIAETDSQ